MPRSPSRPLRSRAWFDNPENVDMTALYLERYLNFGLSLEELRSGKPVATYARAELKRVGRRIANLYVEAWQESRHSPIAALHGHFLIGEPQDAPDPGER